MSKRAFLALIAGLAVVFLASAGAGVWLVGAGRDAGGEGSDLVGGPFRLTDHTGRAVTEADFAGTLKLVYFGYTFCPDICPAGLTTISGALDLLGADAARVKPIFVTVDPERDTVAALAAYSEHFHPRFSFLTGTPEQAAAAAKAWRVYVQKVEAEGASDYLVDHTALTYLMAPKGGYLAHFGHDVTPERLAEAIRAAL